MDRELIRAEFLKAGFLVDFTKDGNLVGKMVKRDKKEMRDGASRDFCFSNSSNLNGFNNNRRALGNLKSEFVFGLGRVWS